MSKIINNTTVTNNLFVVNSGNLGSLLPTRLPPETTALFKPGSLLSNFISGFEQGFIKGFANGFANGLAQNPLTAPSCPCFPPSPSDSTHPAGSLKADANGVVTTPGGYKIEATKQHEWKITGPDGKSTTIWGDPHVKEGDGGKWDFKKDSTFVLGDGTRINVTCKPWSNGETVTGNLEIINGNDRVQITDIDKGKGKTGPVTQDGFQHVNSFAGKQTFVMGQETDDWSFQGKEITGSKGADNFTLGKDLKPLVDTTNRYGGPQQYAEQLTKQITDLMGQMTKMLSDVLGGMRRPLPANFPGGHGCWGRQPNYDIGAHRNLMRDSIRMFGDMMRVMQDVLALSNQVRRPHYTLA